MNDITFRAEVSRKIASDVAKRKAEIEHGERRYADLCEAVRDRGNCPVGTELELPCHCVATHVDVSDGYERGTDWTYDERACGDLSGLGPIHTYYDHGHWHAYRPDLYDGAPDTKGLSACFGTSQMSRREAIEDLLEQEYEHISDAEAMRRDQTQRR